MASVEVAEDGRMWVEWMIIGAQTRAIDAEYNRRRDKLRAECDAECAKIEAERKAQIAEYHAGKPEVAERDALVAGVDRLITWGGSRLIRLATINGHGHEFSIYGDNGGGYHMTGGEADNKRVDDLRLEHVLTPALWIGSFVVTSSVGEGDAPEIAGWECVGVDRAQGWPASVRTCTYVRRQE